MIKHRGFGPGLLGPAFCYGAFWGVGEAGLGHVLHLARIPGLPGLIMIPFAVLVMGRIAAAGPRHAPAAVFLAGVVAASFKLVDLLAPGTDLFALINPIQAILLEALTGAICVRLYGRERSPVPVWGRSSIGTVGVRGRSQMGRP